MKSTMSSRKPSISAACLSLAASVAALAALVSLHILSPEFDPSWRVVSEYALGHYGWVLAIMFLAWAISSWALAFAIGHELTTITGRVALVFLFPLAQAKPWPLSLTFGTRFSTDWPLLFQSPSFPSLRC